MNFTKLIGMKVVAAYDGKSEGFISDVVFNKNYTQIKSLVIVNNLEEKQILNTNKVYKLGEDIILIKNSSAFIVGTLQENKNGIINKQTYDINGKSLGKITEIIINENWKIDKIITDINEFLPTKIICANDYVIINTENSNLKTKNFAPKHKINKTVTTTNLVKIAENNDAFDVKPLTPTQVKVNTSLDLLGKRLERDFVVFGNQVLAPRNTVITSSLLTTAKQMNVLNELYLLVN